MSNCSARVLHWGVFHFAWWLPGILEVKDVGWLCLVSRKTSVKLQQMWQLSPPAAPVSSVSGWMGRAAVPLSNYWCLQPPVPLLPTSGFNSRLGDFVPKPEGNSTSLCRQRAAQGHRKLSSQSNSWPMALRLADPGSSAVGGKWGEGVKTLLNTWPCPETSGNHTFMPLKILLSPVTAYF